MILSKNNKVIWNPWHGCHKCSEGCERCFVFENDRNKGINTNNIKLNRTAFRNPVRKVKNKNNTTEKYELEYQIESGTHILVCDTSDFFIEEADIWRQEAWKFIYERQDCLFEITTKRPERIKQCLPDNWLDGYINVIINVSIENEYRAYERLGILLELDCIKHKGIEISPMLEYFDISPFLSSGLIEKVSLGGESYKGLSGSARPLEISWVKEIKNQCEEYEVPFEFNQTGSRLVTHTGQTINIDLKWDEIGLAKFYKLDIEDIGGINWKATASELELRSLAEQAQKIFNKIQQGR